MKTLWTQTADKPAFPSLNGDVKTDTLIIGGGMAGVLLARRLMEEGADYLLAEAKTIGGGTTCGTTAVLSAQHDTPYRTLIGRFGSERARQYLEANLDAVEAFRALCVRIPCDFEDASSCRYTRNPARAEEFARERDALENLGFKARFSEKTPLPFGVSGAVFFPGMAQFHPLKFLYGAAQSLNIREHTFIRGIEDGAAYFEGGRVEARTIVVATHFPFINKRGLYFMKQYQMRSFVVALENAPRLNETYVCADGDGAYLRTWRDKLLIGGWDRRTGKKGGGFDPLRAWARAVFPGARETCAWAAQDCMSLDGVPYVGRYGAHTPNLYVATGFNEWGMTASMAASSILADAILGRKNPYADAFSPARSLLRPQLFRNVGETLVRLASPAPRRCPHMGCALTWNAQERTWDCPCHGSRFEADGALIDNPAMCDAKV